MKTSTCFQAYNITRFKFNLNFQLDQLATFGRRNVSVCRHPQPVPTSSVAICCDPAKPTSRVGGDKITQITLTHPFQLIEDQSLLGSGGGGGGTDVANATLKPSSNELFKFSPLAGPVLLLNSSTPSRKRARNASVLIRVEATE